MQKIIGTARGIVPGIAFGIFFSFIVATPSSAQTVAQLLEPTAQRTDLRSVLAAWGDEAVGPIVAAIHSEISATPVRLGVLMHALRDIETPAGELGLRSLLMEARPYVRGAAAKLLAERAAKCSVPALVALLGDTAEYAKTRQAQTVTSITVAAVVADSIKQLTGLAVVGSLQNSRTEYEEWWTANVKSLPCGGGE